MERDIYCPECSGPVTLICGIDEAGRGPVIGPLVICGAMFDESDSEKLTAIGVKDSKQLSPSARISLFSKITHMAKDYHVIIIPPAEIDEAVNSSETNLNWLEANKAAEIINILKPDTAVIDCPSPNKLAYKRFLEAAISTRTELVVEHKADVRYPSVSAASILAKVTRDAEVEKLKIRLGVDFGSGYPADPRTKAFLEKNFNLCPEMLRKSWSTHRRLAARQTSLNDFRGD